MDRKRMYDRNKKTLKQSSSPYNSSPSKSSRTSKSTSSSGSHEPDPKLIKGGGPKQGPKKETISSVENAHNDEECEDSHARLRISLNTGERTCSCVCLDAKPVGKRGEKFCGWESKELPCDSKNPYHFPILGGDKDLSEVPEIKVKRKPVVSEPRLINSSSLGYIPTTNQVKHYPFKHCVDGDTSAYIREYREKYTCQNSIAKVMGIGTSVPTHLSSSVVAFGFDHATGKKIGNARGKVPPRLPYGPRSRSSATVLVRRASDTVAPTFSNEQYCPVHCLKPKSSTPQRTIFPHEKYIAKYRMLAMEEKRARQAKCQPSFAYKPELPKPSVSAETDVVLPFQYRPPSSLLARKKIPGSDHSVPKYSYTRNNWRTNPKKNCSSARPTSAADTSEEFYSVIPADMHYLGVNSSAKIDMDDNSPFFKQRQIRTNADREWKRRTTKSVH